MIAEALPALSPNRDWMGQHIEELFRHARAEDPSLRFEVRAIHPTIKSGGKALVNAQSFQLTDAGIEAGIAWACKLNTEEGFNVYIGANPRRPEASSSSAASAADIFPLFPWVFVDADSAEAVEALLHNPGPLHKMMVATGMTPHLRCHCYWQLEEPIRNPSAWSDVQKHLARAFGTDAVHDTPRILRLAGSISYPSDSKTAKGYRKEIVQIAIYDRDAVEPGRMLVLPARVPVTEHVAGNVAVTGGSLHLGPAPRDATALVEAIRRQENRHNNVRDLIAHLVGTGEPDWLIMTLAEELLRGRSDGGTLAEVPALVQGARLKFNRPDPVSNRFDARPQRNRLELVAFKDILVSNAPAYLVKGLIPLNGMIVVWGEPKCGKSFLVYDVAMAIARCSDYRGRRVKGGPVVYVACEGATGFRARMTAYRQRFELSDRTADVPLYLVPDMLGLPTDQNALITSIRLTLGQVRPVLIVLDTLNRSLEGDENAPKDMTAYVRACDAIRDAFGCAVIVVHHCGTEGKRPRGHTSLTGAADCQIAVKRSGERVISATVEYMKDGPEGEALHSRLEVVTVGQDEDGDDITSCVVVEAEPSSRTTSATPELTLNQEAMFRILYDAGSKGLTLKEWNTRARENGLAPNRAASLINWRSALLSKGLIKEFGDRWYVRHSDG
ncbi:MAG: AAA family ATPase [Kiloniellaceae bacterium]